MFRIFCLWLPSVVLGLLTSKSGQPRQPLYPSPSRSISSSSVPPHLISSHPIPCRPVPTGSGCNLALGPVPDRYSHLRIDYRRINRLICDSCEALAVHSSARPGWDLSHEISLLGCVPVFKAGTRLKNSKRRNAFRDLVVQFWPMQLF